MNKSRQRCITDLIDKITKHYQEPARHYHNMNHINQCLVEFMKASDIVKNPIALNCAIWYHDAVYNPLAKDNEEKSAEYAYNSLLKIKFGKRFAEKVKNLVLATKPGNYPLNDSDSRLLADIDLSIFGKSTNEFDIYEKNIRKEYQMIPDSRFKKGRIEILKSILQRPSVYYTDFFRKKYELSARKNLARSIENLR